MDRMEWEESPRGLTLERFSCINISKMAASCRCGGVPRKPRDFSTLYLIKAESQSHFGGLRLKMRSGEAPWVVIAAAFKYLKGFIKWGRVGLVHHLVNLGPEGKPKVTV